jgi:hypothetical protein
MRLACSTVASIIDWLTYDLVWPPYAIQGSWIYHIALVLAFIGFMTLSHPNSSGSDCISGRTERYVQTGDTDLNLGEENRCKFCCEKLYAERPASRVERESI